MANKDLEAPAEYEDGEEYIDEEYEETEEYSESTTSPWVRWAIIGGVALVVFCLGMAVVAYLARDAWLTPVVAMFATETPTPTVTPLPTATFTPPPPTPTATLEPTATQLPSPTPMLLPPAEVMSIVEGPPTLNEQFDDNTRNWTGLSQGAEYTIQQGTMVFKSGQAGQPSIVYCVTDCGPYADRYFYQAEMVDEHGSEAGYGLTFGLDPQRNVYYVFAVRPSKTEYGLFKVQSGQIYPLIDWTGSSAILPAPQPNSLGARFLKNKIDLYINSTWVGEKEDKNNTFTSGRVGIFVEKDGVRLLANQAKVFMLMDVTPEPPGTRPTQAAPVQPPVQPPAGATGQPPAAMPATPIPQATARFTPTPTALGACPNNIPAGQWILVITRVTTPGNRQANATVKINGVTYKLTDVNTVFYLYQNTHYDVEIGNKSFEFYESTCKIIYKKYQK